MKLALLRLSALGDVCNLLPVVATLRTRRPDWRLSWVLGRGESKLLAGLSGVEWIVHDKRAGLSGWLELRRRLAGRRFDAVLALQLSARANLLLPLFTSARKIGYPAARSREGHGLFIDERAPLPEGRHVVDQWLAFLTTLGVGADEFVYDWPLAIPEAAHAEAARMLPEGPVLLVSPCSSHPLRNWLPERYAAVIDAARDDFGLMPVLVGGRSALEAGMAARIVGHCRGPVTDLTGKDTLAQLLAMIARARVLISPDSGPVHFASALGTPVVGLYAATDPARSGPYRFRHLCVDRFAQAARRFLHREADSLPWQTKIEKPRVMALIEVDAVLERLAAALGR